jgi:hypothetical protein
VTIVPGEGQPMVVPIELLRILGIAQRSGEIGHRNNRLSHNNKCLHSESERDTIHQREYTLPVW